MTDAALWTLDAVRKTRASLLDAVDGLPPEAWLVVPDGFSNNVLWNVGHVAVTAELLTYGLAGLDLPAPPAAVAAFRKGTSPSDWSAPPDIGATRRLFLDGVDRLEADVRAGRFDGAPFRSYTTTPGVTLSGLPEALAFNVYHEGLHAGTVLALRKHVG
ncbi:DinB family protein [Rubrivirga sp. S365]|uniref:DinB family protein n=1 Tax=Rubrivirga sp. S365 TaxID=3076080 RepID=UPI0028C78143|nr:DinB family protein [Rubrivirga sp. S365]MDT7856786.1 DinB family protein [Rubrivirga sp. S365]